MRRSKPRDEITLLDVLIEGFEKNEIIDGYHWRSLPLPDEASAVRAFGAFAAEATRWHGSPSHTVERDGRRLAAWPELEIRQAGRGLMIRVRSAWFFDWWHDDATWEGSPMDAVWAWIEAERNASTP